MFYTTLGVSEDSFQFSGPFWVEQAKPGRQFNGGGRQQSPTRNASQIPPLAEGNRSPNIREPGRLVCRRGNSRSESQHITYRGGQAGRDLMLGMEFSIVHRTQNPCATGTSATMHDLQRCDGRDQCATPLHLLVDRRQGQFDSLPKLIPLGNIENAINRGLERLGSELVELSNPFTNEHSQGELSQLRMREMRPAFKNIIAIFGEYQRKDRRYVLALDAKYGLVQLHLPTGACSVVSASVELDDIVDTLASRSATYIGTTNTEASVEEKWASKMDNTDIFESDMFSDEVVDL
ncbi:uncharacterized protein EV422DRAFT_119380 [Fimicolochytrium jonesii]|uniref:uncharacterized protein n=1 Tax=Fimicolochytrium jonesii TaxID=1396493 RepID=UPI0022FF10B6|nr:uncharacterized protein EV422DRAFT_119380 [Fimicolochytrium jonesii]KAI8819147.1 hypothetical protein EV422DRAFT_119380 [Fimicolochytrium jonesii]